jgi:hypothetical protein
MSAHAGYLHQENTMKNNTTIRFNPLVVAIMLSSISAAIILSSISGVSSGTPDIRAPANFAGAVNFPSQTQIRSESKIKLLKQPYVNPLIHLDF